MPQAQPGRPFQFASGYVTPYTEPLWRSEVRVYAAGEDLGGVIIVQSETDLLEIVRTLCSRGSFAHFLNRGDEESDQNTDDRDHYEKFNQREA